MNTMAKLFSLEGITAAVKAIKDKGVAASTSAAKRAVNSMRLTYRADKPYDNGVALTPPMGWSSWNTFRNKIDEDLIYATALAMKNSGLLDCGYRYINIDDCWQSSMRDSDGRLQGDFVKFPSGIKALVGRVNALGAKLGIYTSNGTLTCEDLPASLGNEAVDAETFAEWGVEYFKYDFCHNVPIPSKAPDIEKITVSKLGSSEERAYSAREAVLSGEARIVDDPKLASGCCITGLSANAGRCYFNNVVADGDDEYILTLCIRKKNNCNKYLEITVNGEERYKTTLPATKSFTPDGRHQVRIRLRDGVNTVSIYNPVASKQDSAAIQYTDMGAELKRATRQYAEKHGTPEKPIVFSICEWGFNFPWRWGAKAGNLWRTTADIKPMWASVIGIYEINVLLYKYAGIGAWNDPDMLEVGNGNLTVEENKSHFTLWCMLSAPLILGNDIRKFIDADGNVDYNNKILQIVTNRELIAVDQDKKGVQCRRMKTNAITDILVKPLDKGEVAICFFNKSNTEKDMSVLLKEVANLSYVELSDVGAYQYTDLWSKEIDVTSGAINARVAPHGVRVFRVKSI